jgi:hypothetical protein
MSLAGFELITPACERPQTHALDCTPTGIGPFRITVNKCKLSVSEWRTFEYDEYILLTLVDIKAIAAFLKANSHKACRAHAVPLPCRAAKGLDCLSHLIYTPIHNYDCKEWQQHTTKKTIC